MQSQNDPLVWLPIFPFSTLCFSGFWATTAITSAGVYSDSVTVETGIICGWSNVPFSRQPRNVSKVTQWILKSQVFLNVASWACHNDLQKIHKIISFSVFHLQAKLYQNRGKMHTFCQYDYINLPCISRIQS